MKTKVQKLLEAAKEVEQTKRNIASLANHYLGSSAGDSFYYDLEKRSNSSGKSLFDIFEPDFLAYKEAKDKLEKVSNENS